MVSVIITQSDTTDSDGKIEEQNKGSEIEPNKIKEQKDAGQSMIDFFRAG